MKKNPSAVDKDRKNVTFFLKKRTEAGDLLSIGGQMGRKKTVHPAFGHNSFEAGCRLDYPELRWGAEQKITVSKPTATLHVIIIGQSTGPPDAWACLVTPKCPGKRYERLDAMIIG